jgi:hypothetical protein
MITCNNCVSCYSEFFFNRKGPKAPEAPLNDGHNYKEDPEIKLILEFYKDPGRGS